MNILQAIILGLIQGLTEFIPVSSSGHLVLAHEFLGVTAHGLVFDVALHFGTLLALIAYFRKDLLIYARAILIRSDKTRLAWLLILATIPAAILGYLLEDLAESKFRSSRLVALTMLLFGLVMLLAEYIYARHKKHTVLEEISNKQGLGMGFAQALAIVPGVSRSGSTISAGMLLGLDRVAATRFSFLLGIPIMSGAILKIFSQGTVLEQVSHETTVILVGVVTALVSGLFAIRFLLRYLGNHGLHIFAYYRIALGVVLIGILSMR